MDQAEQDKILDRLLQRKEPSRGRLWLALIVLLTVGGWMICLNRYGVASLSPWDVQDPHRLAPWLLQVLVRYSLHGTVFLLLGILVPGWLLAMWRHRRDRHAARDGSVDLRAGSDKQPAEGNSSWFVRALGGVIALAAQGTLAVCYFVLALAISLYLFGALGFSWGLVLASELGVGVFGLLAGAWLGGWLLQGRRGRRRLVTHALALVLFSGLFGTWLVHAVFQAEPLPFEKATISSADKRALVDSVQRKTTRVNGDRVYRASQDELNKLLAWSISVYQLDGKAKVDLTPHSQTVLASLRLPADRQSNSYVNLAISGRGRIVDEQLDLDFTSLQIGSVTVPRSIINWLGRFAAQWVSQESQSVDLLAGIVRAGANRDGVEVVLADDGIRSRRLAKLLRTVGDHPDVTRAVSVHLSEFAQIAQQAKRKDKLFDTVVKSAFQQAAQRSRRGNPVEENRAAILALGIALGHFEIEKYVGDCCSEPEHALVLRLPYYCQLRGRPDWARHFWVSAAVTLLASDRVSDAAGLLKEELDAGIGGSGFSFGDLMADRAGTEFARYATRDPDAALALQQWILAPTTDLNDLMPQAADLKEGMNDLEMQSQFNGVGGQGFLEMKAELERRLGQAAWRK